MNDLQNEKDLMLVILEIKLVSKIIYIIVLKDKIILILKLKVLFSLIRTKQLYSV